LPVSLEEHETHSLIRIEGAITIALAVELKAALLEGLASGRDLRLELEHAEEIDVTAMQLLWAAEREAAREGRRIVSHISEAAGRAARDAGFERLPGELFQECQMAERTRGVDRSAAGPGFAVTVERVADDR
jgi:anti-anti-sigma regulatory factor